MAQHMPTIVLSVSRTSGTSLFGRAAVLTNAVERVDIQPFLDNHPQVDTLAAEHGQSRLGR
jgi:hypothetical protein